MSMESEDKNVSELATLVGGRVVGDGATLIRGVASLESARAGEIAFVEDAKLLESARASGASCLIVPEGAAEKFLTAGAAASASVDATKTDALKCVIEAARPKLAFALIAEVLHPSRRRAPAVHPTAQVAASAEVAASAFVGAYVQIGEGARVGAGAQILAGTFVGDNVSVGRDCLLHPRVTLYEGVTIGERVILHAGVVVGADGFGYVRDEAGVYHKFPQMGTVLIEDDVEIGALTCVDRGALGQTRIGRGTKIDNLVQVGHNVEIGARVVIASQTGISGSTVIEDDAIIGGQVGMGDHARVQSGAVVGSKAGILPGKIVRAGVWWGIPVQPLDEYKRLHAHINRLPQMRDELKDLRRRLKELEEKLKEDRG
jgi:UDP-3-O-[3-hydroxymyristoyl] glucosamine N-acyltransferase